MRAIFYRIMYVSWTLLEWQNVSFAMKLSSTDQVAKNMSLDKGKDSQEIQIGKSILQSSVI